MQHLRARFLDEVQQRAPEVLHDLRDEVLPAWSRMVEDRSVWVPAALRLNTASRLRRQNLDPHALLTWAQLALAEAESGNGTGKDLAAVRRGVACLTDFNDKLEAWTVRWNLRAGAWLTRHAMQNLEIWHRSPKIARWPLWSHEGSRYQGAFTREVETFTFTVQLEDVWEPSHNSRAEAEKQAQREIRAQWKALESALEAHFASLERRVIDDPDWIQAPRLPKASLHARWLVDAVVRRRPVFEISLETEDPKTGDPLSQAAIHVAVERYAERIGLELTTE